MRMKKRAKRRKKKYKQKNRGKKGFELVEIRYAVSHRMVNKFAKGDLVLELCSDRAETIVHHPARVLGSRLSTSGDHYFLQLERNHDRTNNTWPSLNNHLKKNNITYISKKSNRQIEDESVKKVLLNYFGNY